MAIPKSGIYTEIDIVRYIVKDLIDSYATQQSQSDQLKRTILSRSQSEEKQLDTGSNALVD
jgi:hypothetical protein